MLRIHFSNRYEALLRVLLDRLAEQEASPFEALQVVVPSAAVRRSLTLAMADRFGVCAQVRFGFLAQWLWEQIARVVPSVARESPFAPQVLRWRIDAALADAAFVAPHARLRRYVDGADEVMRLELATAIARTFDQYLTYRPDWLDAWQAGRGIDLGDASPAQREDERWQAALWQRLAADLGALRPHPAEEFVAALERGGAGQARAAGLPAAAHVFALPTMPPLYMQLLERIGRWVDIDLYVINPSEEYWSEIVSGRRLGELALRGRAQGHEEGNRLLAAWGTQTQSLIANLVELCGDAVLDEAHFEPLAGARLLDRLHDAVLSLTQLEPGSVVLADDDRSIEVHVCHSMTRQVEALHQRLLDLFARDASLGPGDVFVLVPDLDAAAAQIDAVFGTAPQQRRIPYVISGRARAAANVPARVLLELLSLATSRMPASAVFGLLQQPLVARRFGLDDDALARIHGWLIEADAHWALDARQRGAMGLPQDGRGTLDDAIERLYLGYALPAGADEPFDGRLAAAQPEGSDAAALGILWRYLEALRTLRGQLASPHTPTDWQALIGAAAERFMAAEGDDLADLRELRDALRHAADEMRRGGVAQPVGLGVMRAALEQALDDPARGAVPTGAVTFAPIGGLRGLPARVVCVIGLDDGRFPSTARPPEFDLMPLRERRGDRQRRLDERNLFLDLLLSARSHLHLSYTGRSVRDNAELPPSVLVSELLDVLVAATASDPGDAQSLARARRRLVVEHPLQPFSLAAFELTGDERLRSFDTELAQALRRSVTAGAEPPQAPGSAASTRSTASAASTDAAEAAFAEGSDELDEAGAADDQAPAFLAQPLPAPDAGWQTVDVERLAEFFRNPCRFLLRRRLEIALAQPDDELQDDEPFVLDGDARRRLVARLLPAMLGAQPDPGELQALALAATDVPLDTVADLALGAELAELERFAAPLRSALRGPVREPVQIDQSWTLEGELWRLGGVIADPRADGVVRWRHVKLSGADVVQAWVLHLALCAQLSGASTSNATRPDAVVLPRTTWFAQDRTIAFRAPSDARALLGELVALYRRGLREPLHFFPKSSWVYMEGDRNLGAALRTWQPGPHSPYAEGADAACRLAFRGRPMPIDEEFEALAEAVFGPALAHLDGADASAGAAASPAPGRH